MHIAINARVLNERKGGPYRYTINVLRELSKIDRTNTYYILLYDDYNFDFELPKNYKIIIKKTKSKVYFDYIYLPLFSKNHNIDVWFFPKNTFSPVMSHRVCKRCLKEALYSYQIIKTQPKIFITGGAQCYNQGIRMERIIATII